MILTDKLLLSSMFYSCQGEGISSGVPSYFIRLGLCNLQCGMSAQFLNKLKKEKSLENGEIFVGDLHKEGKATWTCDSTSQWAWRSEYKEFQQVIDEWKKENLYEDIKSGLIHIIWTGGEPTLPKHQESIVNFSNYWRNLEFYNNSFNGFSPYYEIETNGTIFINDVLFDKIDQINCSPKLENSGQAKNKRIVPIAIKRIMEHDNYQFKFVVSTEDDIKEMFRDFIKPFNIPMKNVVCMPGLDNQEDFHERTHFILEMSKKYRFRGLTRLHISAYDQVIDV
jgi:organic radical activating enzyme